MSNIDNAVRGDETVESVVNRYMGMFEEWARERNFYAPNGATYDGQYFKLMEEKGELAGGIARNSVERIKDAIGDILCVLAVLRGFKLRPEWDRYTTVRNISVQALGMNTGMADIVWAYDKLQGFLKCTAYSLIGTDFDNIASALASIASQYNLTLPECVAHVWGEIKDRKGVMYNGVFIKESDPRYAELADLGEVPCIDEGCEHSGTTHYCVNSAKAVQDIGCSGIDIRSMQEDDIVDN